MILNEHVPLRELTTLRVGGTARYVITCDTKDAVQNAVAFAKERGLPFFVLGGGSNVLAPDTGYGGVILLMRIEGIEVTDNGTVTTGAGVDWNELVDTIASRGWWGTENLAGIPGTVGAAPVQNIGAYGAELADTFLSAEVLDTKTGEVRSYAKEDCGFGYRDSTFKRDTSLIILSVTFQARVTDEPRISYKDLTAYVQEHGALTTPADVAQAVRAIRAKKFPDLATHGTAGSFFKNPTISADAYAALLIKYPELPRYEAAAGIKIPLAWILDHVLALRGYSVGHVQCFPMQPLVIVTEEGASANDVDAFADDIARRVHDVTNIFIEREVRALK